MGSAKSKLRLRRDVRHASLSRARTRSAAGFGEAAKEPTTGRLPKVRIIERDVSEEHIYLLCAFWFRSEASLRTGSDLTAERIPVVLISMIRTFLESIVRVREDFELLKVVGRGSFGKVFAVRDLLDTVHTDNVYAMKVIKKKNTVERKQVTHTMDELRIYKLLSEEPTSPFLVKMHWAFETDSKLYFILDFYDGGELFFHLKRFRRFPEAQTVTIAAEMVSAIGHLHDRFDVVHRNIKPEVVLLRRNGHCVLIDCGLSKQVADGSAAHTFCGTPEYLAPEIIASTGHSKAVDWWAIGILIYEMLVGIPPFYNQNMHQMYTAIQTKELKFPPSIGGIGQDLITGLLKRPIDERLGSNGTDEVKAHNWWHTTAGIESSADFWQRLERLQIEPRFKPRPLRDDLYSEFDKAFLSETVTETPGADDRKAFFAEEFAKAAGEPFVFF